MKGRSVRKTIILACMLGLGVAAWHGFTRRTVAVALGESGYDLAFTVDWGLNMHQRFTLKQHSVPWSGTSSNWISIFKRPYNSGATLYVSDDGTTYYVSTGYNLVLVFPAEGRLRTTCDDEVLPEMTEFAIRLSQLDWTSQEELDPDGPRLFGYIRAQDISEAPDQPAASKYYIGVRYIGRFGVIGSRHGGARGDGVGFVPASAGPEPRMGLGFSCG